MQSVHKPQYMEFIARLRKARKAKRISQAQLGARLNKPQSFVSKVETCERRLDLIEASEWCLALGIKLETLFPPELRALMDSVTSEEKIGDKQ